MLTVPDRIPRIEGLKVTWKVVVPLAATVADGVPVRLKSAPVMAGVPLRVRMPVPVFSIVKVRTTEPEETSAVLKSVWSEVAGELSPSVIDWLLLLTFISGSVPVPWIEKL